MTGQVHRLMTCQQVDELAGAIALDALDAEQRVAITDHQATCGEAHAEIRTLLGAPLALASGLEPMVPDPAVRARLMRTISSPPAPVASRQRWSGWTWLTFWRGLAAAAVVVAVAVGVWNVSLRSELETRTAALSAVAEAIAGGAPAYPVSGPAGTGYVIDTAGPGSTFLVAGLASLPSDELYEMWLIDADGLPLAVGTIDQANADLVVATLEQDLAGFAVFAVTVEPEVVEAPTSDPVMAGSITN